MSNELKKIVKEIQFKTDKTIEEIATEVGYARAYFTNQVNIGTNKKLKEHLEKYLLAIEQNVRYITLHGKEGRISSIINDDPVEYKKPRIEEKYLSLLEKTISDKDKNIEEQKADIQTYRSAIQKITSVDEKVAALELIVNDLRDKVGGEISNIEVLREWLIDQFSKLKKESPQSVAASMGRKREELYQKEKQRGTHAG